MESKQPDDGGLGPPVRIDLPYFSYGLFKPGEIAHGQIEPLLDGEPVETAVAGALYVRDGLPLLDPGGTDPVLGYLLRFRVVDAEEAYGRISAFEPPRHYRWDTVGLMGSKETANALVGRSPNKGSIRDEEGLWTGRHDPVLTVGPSVVRETAEQFAGQEFASAARPDDFDWPRLFRLQMAYLFLWTVIERYAALAYGPSLEAMQKVRRLGEDPAFEQALKRVVTRSGRVHRSDKPTDHADLNPDRGYGSALYYYYVRSNITHRGKGAWRDGEIVRRSLLELLEIFREVLEERMGSRV